MLIHGIGMSHRYFARLQAALARHARVLTIDLPGFGALARPPRSVSVSEMAEALGRVVDALRLTGVVLVGHSMGTQWVTELAVTRPNLPAGVVLIGPVTHARHRSTRAHLLMLGADCLREPLEVNHIVFTDYWRCGPGWYFRQLPQMLSYRIEDRLGSVSAPVLLVRGGQDSIATLAWIRFLLTQASSGELLVVAGHGHVVQHTAAPVLDRALRDFASRIRDSASTGRL
ncbi:alpha/beta fold hydrolase [Pseudoclavibacter sp. RFBA6]|uniref:alpha/beta fold hydrolase n=1 Tax=Pseudoclavibacter sp. RFBA6 TaxID=2080573 RepID=UPI0015E21752|nr:alpha/beta hydrolase [Pseudoclavibacter sp. RFBA6]